MEQTTLVDKAFDLAADLQGVLGRDSLHLKALQGAMVNVIGIEKPEDVDQLKVIMALSEELLETIGRGLVLHTRRRDGS